MAARMALAGLAVVLGVVAIVVGLSGPGNEAATSAGAGAPLQTADSPAAARVDRMPADPHVAPAIPVARAAAPAAAPARSAGPTPAGSRPAQEPPPKSQPAAPAAKSVLIADVPHIRQKPDFCGEACAAMYLARLGWNVGQDYVFDQSGLDPLLARGCWTKELAAALAKIGFRTGPVWNTFPADEQAEHLAAQWKALYADLAAGVPSIVCMHYGAGTASSEHFRLVLGYDASADEVIYHEPAVAGGAYRRMKRPEFLKLWPLRAADGQAMAIRLRLEPGPELLRRIAAASAARAGSSPAKPATLTAADYAQHMMQLKKKVPAEGFTIVVQPPFVVIGDEPAAMVRRRATATVKWAADKLKDAYFEKDPADVIDIWLFKDNESYRKHCKSIFGDEPDTPYGYFSHTDNALIMNIATGGGTLVHEIVHPFVASNFPECPSWLNEGLGSLYEQSAERDGKIVGLTNWRLRGLQEAIGKKQVSSFRDLCTTTTSQFYNMDKGTNYAQARYLCYYLQEAGLLRKYYRAFHAARNDDPSGYQTLKRILGRKDEKEMDEFKRQWEAWVLKLRFP
jgi:hypothetical protein